MINNYRKIWVKHVQPLLCNRRLNNGEPLPVSRQRIGKHLPVKTNTYKTVELLLETVFSTQSVQIGYKEDNWGYPVGYQLRQSYLEIRP
jgi:hypothetical protein